MKKKLNLSNALKNAESIEEPILREESKKAIKRKTYILEARYYKKVSHWKIIDQILRSSIGKSWNEARNILRTKIPQQYHYRIDDAVLYKNRNNNFVNSLGRPKELLNTIKTTGPIYTEYYVEDDIIKLYKPYIRFPRERKYKTIQKKVKPVDKKYITNFDYDIIDNGSNNLKDFLKILESNKKTYRVKKLDTVYGDLKYDHKTGRFDRKARKEFVITNIKTHYEI